MKSIQTKITLLILACVLLSAGVVGGVGILSAQRSADRDSTKIMNLMCEDKAKEMDALLSRIEQSVKTLAVYTIGQLEDLNRLKNDSAYLLAYVDRVEEVAVNAAGNTDGAVAVYVRLNPDFTPPTSGLFWSKDALDGDFRPRTPTDLSRFAPTDTEHVGWYYTPIKNGTATWLDPYWNQNINIQMISYVIPLYMDSEAVGVVGMDIDFAVFSSLVEKAQIYQTGDAFLTDAAANIIYHRSLKLGTNLAEVSDSLKPLAGELENGNRGTTLFSYAWEGQKKTMVYRNLSNGMRLVVTAPTAEIAAEKNTLIMQIGFVLLVGALISVVLTVLLTRRIVRPLKELNVAAQKIAEGDFSITLIQKSKDEVGTLTESFQKTVAHLQQYISYINGLAYRDSLTSVKNKTAYLEAESRLEERMRLGRPEFGIVMLDINGLKQINDTFGHDFGDMIIISACRLICKTFSHSPVYRIGGDEFVVILEGGDYENRAQLLENLEQEIESHNAMTRNDTRVSIARGIAIYDSETDLVFAHVFKRADEAMYRNKAAIKQKEQENLTLHALDEP